MSETPKRVLLVDDDVSLRATLSANLELEGFEVLEAASAREALSLLERETVDVVLTDIRMPERSGVQLFHDLKARFPDIPVVLMTAFTREEERFSAIDRGAYGVLSKPFPTDRAVSTLMRALRKPAVLVVDDLEAQASTLAAALESVGLKAQTATDAASAETLVRAGIADVCIVDLVMPSVNGVELLERLRKIDPSIVVLVVTGYDVPDLVRAAAARGAFLCMRKPVEMQALIRQIATARSSA